MPDSKAILANIKSNFQQEEFPAKTLLVEEGHLARKLYFIEKGLARVFLDSDGKQGTFQFLKEGHFISSYESILSHEPSWYSIETLEPMVVYSATADQFRQKMEQFSNVKEFYYRYIQD